jgi:hypothetical protein
MKKRAILVAAIAAIALVAAACTSNSSSSSSGSNSSGAPVEITMWHGYGKVIDNQGQTNFEAKSLTDLVDQYNAMNTGVHVTLDYIGSNDHALEKLTVALNGARRCHSWRPPPASWISPIGCRTPHTTGTTSPRVRAPRPRSTAGCTGSRR